MLRKFRLLPVVLTLLCMLTVSGCGSDGAKESAETAPDGQTTEVTGPEAVTENNASAGTAGIIRGKVTDGNSNMLIAGIVITDEEGGIVRQTTNAYGGYELCLEPGTYTLTFSKGAEYATEEKTVEVESLKTKYLPDVRLTQLYDSYAKGWIAGDCHQHTYYSDGVDSVQSLMISNASVGLYWGFLTDHNTSRGVPEWTSPISVNVASDEKGALRPFVGFDGFVVAIIAGNNPFYLPFAALFLGYLRSGALQMSRVGILPNELIYVIQAIIIIIFGAKTFISMVKKRRGGSDT